MTPYSRTCAFFFIAAAALAGPKAKIAPDLRPATAGEAIDVIVQFNGVPTLQHHLGVIRRGGIPKADLGAAHAALYSVPGGRLQALAEDPDVVYISPDRPLQKLLDVTSPSVNAPNAWQYGWTGKGVGIAIIDSGISDDPDLHDPATGKTRVLFSQAFGVTGTVDVYGHGTHVAGIAGGSGSASKGKYTGIAPGVNLINLRVLDDKGAGTDSNVIAAIQAAIQLKSKYNIRVINLSLGRRIFESYTQDPLCQAVEAAWKAGIAVVVAAGNDGRNNSGGAGGYATITAPGNDPYVITVGAMKTAGTISRGDDLIASYSSRGPTLIDHIVKPDLVAPGNQVVSTLGKGGHTLSHNYPQNDVSGNYFRLSGTSMAAPVVSGIAALMLQRFPSLTPDQVKAVLMKTASKTFPSSSVTTDPNNGSTYTSYYDVFTIGAGYVDAWAALNSTDLPGTTVGATLSPAAYYDAATGSVYVTPTGSFADWGTHVVWGDFVILAGNVVWGDITIFGEHVVWGDDTMQGFSTIWGTSASLQASTQTGVESLLVTIFGEN